MLSYDDCVRLKAAGFPNSPDVLLQWCETSADSRTDPIPTSQREPAWELLRGTQGFVRHVACPNSDELLDAIQARWPGAIHVVLNPATGIHAHWIAPKLAANYQTQGESPAEALCALYCKLAEGESKP